MSLRIAGPLLAAIVLVGCGITGPRRPSRDTVLPLLQTEAQSLKRDGEKVNPALGVQSTWNIEAVDVQEQEDAAKPWRGTIRFRIETRMREPDGMVTSDRLDKNFDYVWDAASKRWLIQYTPRPPGRPATR